MNRIAVTALDKKFGPEAKKISALARKFFLSLKKSGLSADIYLADNQTMRKFNRVYRKKDKPTNVLSFSEPKGFVNAPSRYRFLGEVYLGPDFIKSHGQDINLMAVHGLLHLVGYDHKTAKERRAMEKKERLVLNRLS